MREKGIREMHTAIDHLERTYSFQMTKARVRYPDDDDGDDGDDDGDDGGDDDGDDDGGDDIDYGGDR